MARERRSPMEARIEPAREESRVPISVPFRLMWLQLRSGGLDAARAGDLDLPVETAREGEPKG